MTPAITADADKLKAANEALSLFARGTTIEVHSGRGFVVKWTNDKGKVVERRWPYSSKSEGRPQWFGSYPYSGTIKSALVQLILWLQGKPVLRLSYWTYWAGDSVGIHKDIPKILEKAGYPATDICLNCERLIQPNVNWCTGRGGQKGVKCVSAIQNPFSGE